MLNLLLIFKIFLHIYWIQIIKKIIIIKRSLPNIINFIIYVLPMNIDSNISENSNIFLTPYYDIYNKNDKKIYISFIYDNKIFIYNKLIFIMMN